MPQSPWFSFTKVFDITADTSPWDCEYDRQHPIRRRFRADGANYGFQQKSAEILTGITNLRFDNLDGVYIIAYHKKPIYVGHAQGGESILSRLAKHRIKLTGSKVLDVTHPRRWQEFVRIRYNNNKGRQSMLNDTLKDFSFSAFYYEKAANGLLSAALLRKLRLLERRIYWYLKEKFPEEMTLNDPSGLGKGLSARFEIMLPEDSKRSKPKTKKSKHRR